MTRVGIINVTGYAGMELARILLRHPSVRLTSVTGRSLAGQRLDEVFPFLNGGALTITEELDDVDLAFSALPHRASAEIVAPLVRQGTPVVDLSADFRLRDRGTYEGWYRVTHPAPDLLAEAVYGLPELHAEAIRRARLVASPGCYPTAALLALGPALRTGIIDDGIIIDAKSGVSGAGRSLSLTTHFSEVNESVSAYALDGHRHHPEIAQEIAGITGTTPRVTFIPHLVPMTRGILATCYADLDAGFAGGATAVRDLYTEAYAHCRFIRIASQPPQTKYTSGSNDCLVYPMVDERTRRLIVVSCLDNLVKGAAGQAVQAMNLMLGLPEDLGLDSLALYP